MNLTFFAMPRFDGLSIAAALAVFALPAAALGQVSSYPAPYNGQDPQNYSSPAGETYQNQYAATQQGVYPTQQGVYGPDGPQQGYGGQDQQQYAAPYAGQQIVQQAPPPLPEYDQPEAPGDGYIWTPGSWAWGNGGYYWVNGQWSLPPYQGALYTPGYWADYEDGYFWNAGYWGPVVGFYGGINYGFGYFGTGFYGGYWRGGRFCYNGFYNHLGSGFRGGYYNQRVGDFHPGYHFAGGRAYASQGFAGGGYHGGGFNGGYQGNIGHLGEHTNVGRGFAAPGSFASSPYRESNSNGVTAMQGSGIHAGQGFSQSGNLARPQTGAPIQQSRPLSFSGASRPSGPAPSGGGVSRGGFSGGAAPGGGGFRGGSASGGGGGGGFHGGGGRR